MTDEGDVMGVIREELPEGLQLLLLQYHVTEDKSPIREDNPWGFGGKDEHPAIRLLTGLDLLFGTIGFGDGIWRGDYSPFSEGSATQAEYIIGIVATPALLQKWLQFKDGGYGLAKLGWRCPRLGETSLRFLPKWKLLSNLKSLEPLSEGFWVDVGFKRVPFDIGGAKPGDFARWIIAAQATDDDFSQLSQLAEACNGDMVLAAKVLTNSGALAAREPSSFLVPGLIPYGTVTELAGNRKVGKSTLALELAAAVARREPTWAGFPLNSAKGIAVYLSGEDHETETFSRIVKMTGGSPPFTLWIEGGSDLDAILEDLQGQRVALLVVDPARKYYVGDEDGSDAASGFFTKLEDFARKTDAAVLVTHHLKKGAHPRNVSDVANHIRGSGVFLDRPRVIIAAHRAGDQTQLGIPVIDGTPLHNFTQSEMFSGVRRLRRDETTFRHVPIGEGAAPSTAKEANPEDTDRVFKAAHDMLASGVRLTRTGPAGLFERKLSALAGLSQAKVRAAVEALAGQGRLNADSAGVLTLPAASEEEPRQAAA
jgi:hypothetical protein